MLVDSQMAVPFPHQYETTVVRTLGSRGRIDAPPRAAIAGGPPPELDGDAASWSPEHLLLSAIGLCLLTTFEALAARDRVEVVAWTARMRGTIDRTGHGLVLTAIAAEVELEVDDPVRARATLAEAERHCAVVNALRVPVEVLATIRASGQPPDAALGGGAARSA